MKVIAVQGEMARVDMQGVETKVALDLVEGVSPGDYLLVHAGFAIQKVSAEEAIETLAILERLVQ
jgi:hydrogenase expression/formation protein HypC